MNRSDLIRALTLAASSRVPLIVSTMSGASIEGEVSTVAINSVTLASGAKRSTIPYSTIERVTRRDGRPWSPRLREVRS